MTCIIVDDEPLAREAIEILIDESTGLELLGSFSNVAAATEFMLDNRVDLLFLDIQMPGTNGIEFAKTIPKETLIIFSTAFSEFASESYEVDAIDYLIKPIRLQRFKKSIEKAQTFSKLLKSDYLDNNIESVGDDYFFVKADRKIIKIFFKQILFIQGLKDYVVLQTDSRKIITAMNIKTIYDQLPKKIFTRVSKSYVVNVNHIESIDNNTVFIGKNEVPIGNTYRDAFFDEFVTKKILGRQ